MRSLMAIVNQMERYNAQLVENPATISSAYMDPRYQRLLTSDQKSIAVIYLVQLDRKIRKLQPSVDVDVTSLSANRDENSFENEIASLMTDIPSPNTSAAQIPNLEEKLKGLLLRSSDRGMSVRQYWRSRKEDDPDMYTLAMTIHMIPPTQTTVERAFSTLSIVLNARRNRLRDDSLESMLLVKLNSELYEKCVESVPEI